MTKGEVYERIVPGFHVVHHRRTLQVWSKELKKWVELNFDIGGWEKLIRELNNPPDIGVEASEGTTISETIAGN